MIEPRWFVSDPVIPLTKMYSKEINIDVFTNEYRRKEIASNDVKSWKQPKYPSVGDWQIN